VYEFGDSWKQVVDDIDGVAYDDRLRFSVAMSGNSARIVVGAKYHDKLKGHVRVYEFGWEQLGNDIDGEAGGDQSGSSVAMSGNATHIAIGAP